MGEYLVLCVDHLFTPESLPLLQGQEVVEFPGKSSSSGTVDPFASVIASKENKEKGVADEGEPFLESVECRICQEEDSVKNLEIPCACSGTLKAKHWKMRGGMASGEGRGPNTRGKGSGKRGRPRKS